MFRQPIKHQNAMSSQDKLAEAARLRDQLRREIIESNKLCSYEPHECRHLRVENYDYCQLHILEDDKAPYKQCSYIYNSTGKKCYLPAAKIDNKLGYCQDHIKKAAVAKNKSTQKVEPVESAETILHSLIHYVKPTSSRHRTQSNNSDTVHSRVRTLSNSSVEKDDEGVNLSEDDSKQFTKTLDPIKEIDATKVNTSCNEILEYASESDSDVEPTVYNNVWHSQNADMSDNESIDSECDDPLKHAEIYTAEEVCSLTRDKLIRLQDLYAEQFKFLQRILREKKRKYIHALKKEKETYASIHNQVRDNPKECNLYRKLKCLNAYHRRSGVEAILQKRVNDLRAKLIEGSVHKVPAFTKCLFTEGGVKCGIRALPNAKHCLKHILSDPMQVLFRACGVARGDADMICHEPVPDVFPGQACVYHTEMPPIRSYTHMKRDDDDPDSSNETTDVIKSDVASPQHSFNLNRLLFDSNNSNNSQFIQEQQQQQVTTSPLPLPPTPTVITTTTVSTSSTTVGGEEFTDDQTHMFDILKVEDISSNVEIEETSVVDDLHLQVEESSEIVVDTEAARP